MKIERNATVADLKNQFNQKFEGLNIQFYSKAHEDHEGSSNLTLLEESSTLKEINAQIDEHDIDLNPKMSVSGLSHF